MGFVVFHPPTIQIALPLPCFGLKVFFFNLGLFFHFSGYVVEKMNPKNGRWEKVPGTIPPDKTSFRVPKLKEGEEYEFRVMAENKNGVSEPLQTTKPTKAKNPFGKLAFSVNTFI